MSNRNRKYSYLGREIGRSIRHAMRSGNFEELGRTVDNSVRKFTGGFDFPGGNTGERPPFGCSTDDADNPSSRSRNDFGEPAGNSAFRDRMPGGISGFILAILGIIILAPMFIADISILGAFLTGYIIISQTVICLSVFLPITAASLLLTIKGIALRHRAKRFDRYREAIGGAAFCKIDKLADTAGENVDRVKKDLRKMIDCGACPQGHFDHTRTCFMVDDATYEEYLEAEKAYAARTQEKQKEDAKKRSEEKSAELENIEKEGNSYLKQIREINDALPGEVISEKLDKLEKITARIFESVRNHPEKLPDIRRFMRYYMPTTLKLVKSYKEFETQPVQGQNITSAKQEIEKALDTINAAFANLLDTLFADDAIDISSDISTLETMLKQEGLTGSDFKEAPGDTDNS